MARVVALVEALLHGEYTGRDFVRRDRPVASVPLLVLIVVVLGSVYGCCMALYGLRWGSAYGGLHVFAVMVKVPALFLLTLLVTAPSLYVFSALAGSSLAFGQTVRLLLTSIALSLAVLASFAPVTAFFTFSTSRHPFMQLLNAAAFTVSGLVGMAFVRRRLAEALDDGDEPRYGPAGRRARRVTSLLFAWFVVYGAVAAQMGWLLRPFIGTPHLPQELFRATEGNIFQGLFQALRFLD